MTAFVQGLRPMDLYKVPGVAETLDWTQALLTLNQVALDPDVVLNTLGVLLKVQEDLAQVSALDMDAWLAGLPVGG